MAIGWWWINSSSILRRGDCVLMMVGLGIGSLDGVGVVEFGL